MTPYDVISSKCVTSLYILNINPYFQGYSFQFEINFLFLENRDKSEKSLFILIFNHLIFEIHIRDFF